MDNIFKPKFFSLLKSGFSKKQILQDSFSGIVVGIVALPLAIAFAVASGVAPNQGLITAIIAGFIIAILGGSRVQIGGPTGAFIIIVYSIVQQYGINGLIISTVLAGFILIIFGILRLGNLLKFFPQPLIIGFTSGIALIIFSTQVKYALGIESSSVPAGFIQKWGFYFSHFQGINFTALSITLITIFIILLSGKLIKKLPGSFLAIVIVTVFVSAFRIPVDTIETYFGDIPTKISFTLPAFEFKELGQYFVPALTIAMLGAIESLLSAVVADGMIGGNHRSNTELIAQGVANIVTPFFGGIPATGAIARTATNIKNGGRTPIAGIIHSVILLLIMLFFGKWAKLIPLSCLAGILMVVAYNMSEWRSFKSILGSPLSDVIVLLSTFFLTVLVDLTVAIEVGVVLSALLFMKRMADAGTSGLTDIDSDVLEEVNDLPAEVGVFEISGPFFFGSAKHYSSVIKKAGLSYKILIIRMRHVPFIDSTGVYNFKGSIGILKRSNITVLLSGVNKDVRNSLNQSGISKLVGERFIFDSFEEAITFARRKAL